MSETRVFVTIPRGIELRVVDVAAILNRTMGITTDPMITVESAEADPRRLEIETLAESLYVQWNAHPECVARAKSCIESAEDFLKARDEWRAKRKANAEAPTS